jgi:hypothetical protein
MENKTKEELLRLTLQYLETALSHIIEVKGCEPSSNLSKIIVGALGFGEAIYKSYKK